MALTGDIVSLRKGSLIDRAETGVAISLVVEAREVFRERPPAGAGLSAAPLAAGYGGGAVTVDSDRGNGSPLPCTMAAAIGTVDGGCACDTASL